MTSPQSPRFGKRNGSGKSQRRVSPSNLRRRLQHHIQRLESRHLLASLAGEVWGDSNANGVRDDNEPAAIDVRVFVDSNDDGMFSPQEAFTRTDSMGRFVIDQVAAGSHVVRVELRQDQSQVSPLAYYGMTTVAADDTNTQLFRLAADGLVTTIGGSSGQRIDGVIENQAGDLFGLSSDNDTVYRISKGTGAVAALSTATVDLQSGLAYDAQTDTIFTTALIDGALELMTVDPVTGEVANQSTGVDTLLVSNFGSTFFEFDLASQTSTQLPRSNGFFSSSSDERSDGAVFGLQGNQLIQYSILPEGTSGTNVSTLSSPISSISFGANDQLFGVRETPSALFQIDPVTGTTSNSLLITLDGASIPGVAGFDIAADGTHYLIDSNHLYTFDPTTGVATRMPNAALGPFEPIMTSLTVAADGSLFATLFSSETPIASIDPATGIATKLGNFPIGTPYSSIVAGDSFAVPRPLVNASTTDLTFDSVNRRIVGFDDTTDRFFEFDLLGRSNWLAVTERPFNASSLAFNGNRFVMFDTDDPDGRSIVQVDPDTGEIEPLNQSSIAVAADALGFSARSLAHRVTVGSLGSASGLDFGLEGEFNRIPIGEGMFINELVLDVDSEIRQTHQAIELRGVPNSAIDANTYLVAVDESGSTPGAIQSVIDLSNQVFGSNGFLVLLPDSSPYAINPQSTVLRSTATGFSGLPGGIFSGDNSDVEFGQSDTNSGFFLLQSDVPPVAGEDIDVNDDGIAENDGVTQTWNVIDSLALHPNADDSTRTYAEIVFIQRGTTEPANVIRPENVLQIVVENVGYAARIGDSLGHDADDWVVGAALDVAPLGQSLQLALDDGSVGEPIPLAFQGRLIDHFGESNFVGGVRGDVRLVPLTEGDQAVEPATGVTVLADTNNNGRADVLGFRLSPDSFAVGENLTNVMPGVTLVSHEPGLGANGSTGIKIEPAEESLFGLQGNRIFSSEGNVAFAQNSQHFRAEFYRPAQSVSIVGISAGLTTHIRLDAYDVDGNLIGTQTSGALNGSQREQLRLSFSDDVIAYAEAYSLDDFVDVSGTTVQSSTQGMLDDFAYTQTEATTTTDEFGEFEITNLMPTNYQITFINSSTNRELFGAQAVPIGVSRFENYIIHPNHSPVADDLEISLVENTPPGTVVGQVVGSDAESGVTYSIVGDSPVQIDSDTGQLSVASDAVLDFETTPRYQVLVQVADVLGATSQSTINITLTDINEAPVVPEVQIFIGEDAAVGSAIGQISATDPDTMPDQRRLSYTVIGGSGASSLAVDHDTGVITLTDPDGLNFEDTAVMTLVVTVSDHGAIPLSTTVTQTISITDVNDAPQLLTPDLIIDENVTGVIGAVTVSDQDRNQQHFFQVDGGSGEDFFQIDTNGEVAVRSGVDIDFETQSSYQLIVTVIDNGVPTRSDQGTVNISVKDVDEPADIALTFDSVGENAVAGDVVGQLVVTDPENNVNDYSVTLLDELDGSAFALTSVESTDPNEQLFDVVVQAGAAFDYETDDSLAIVFRVDDLTASGQSVRIEKTLAVTNQNDPPTVVTESFDVSEAVPSGPENRFAKLRFADVDPNETLTAAIIGGTGMDQFVIDPNTHWVWLKPGAVLDADVPDPTLTLIVQVTDSGGLTGTGTVQVHLNNVNEPPQFHSTLGEIAVQSGNTFEQVFDDSFVSDPEGGEFRMSVFDNQGHLPDWVTFDSVTNTLYATPNPNTLGIHQFTLRAYELSTTKVNDMIFSFNAQRGDHPLTNQRDPLDVNNSRSVSPSDLLMVLNFLGTYGHLAVNGESPVGIDHPFEGFVDVNSDGFVSPLDAHIVIEGLAAAHPSNRPVGEAVSLLDSDREESIDLALLELTQASLF